MPFSNVRAAKRITRRIGIAAAVLAAGLAAASAAGAGERHRPHGHHGHILGWLHPGHHLGYRAAYDREPVAVPRYAAPAYRVHRRAPTIVHRASYERWVDRGSALVTAPAPDPRRFRSAPPPRAKAKPSHWPRRSSSRHEGRVVGVKRHVVRCRGYRGRPETFVCTKR